jgi:hypothetical protein
MAGVGEVVVQQRGGARCSISSHGRGLVVAGDGASRRPPLGLASGYGGQSESRPGGAEQGGGMVAMAG